MYLLLKTIHFISHLLAVILLFGKTTHGGTYGSSCICSREWPCWTSKGGEALGPDKARCPSIVECQEREAEVGGLVSRGKRDKYV